MILEKQTESLIYQEGEFNNTLEMSLDSDSSQVLMQMLSKNLYSDAIGSTIRECASNAIDSHRRANVSDPIIVSLRSYEKFDSWEFTVEDFGMGLDADDVENIISKYGKSTKRSISNELGMFGIGFKSPLAYSSSFYFTCRKNGIERKYMMYEGENTNSIDLLYEKPTSERNGVKIIIPIKYSDYFDFIKKIKEQLAYFENVYFDVPTINNNFKIHRTDNYQVSDICNDNYLHVCLDNVYYPLDLSKIKLTNIKGTLVTKLEIGIGLRFSLTDGLFPTPNRENIRYTQQAKEIIKKKIELIADEMMIKYNKSIVNTENIIDAINYYTSNRRYIKNHNNINFEISDLLNFSNITRVEPTLLNVKYFTANEVFKIREHLFNEYKIHYTLVKSKISNCKRYWDQQLTLNIINNHVDLVIFNGVFSERKRRYIKELWKNKNVKFIKKTKFFTLFSELKDESLSKLDMTCYYNLLKLYNYDRSKWREIILEFQGLVNNLTKSFIDLDAIDIPQSWIIADKANNYKIKAKSAKVGKLKEKGDINVKEAVSPERKTEYNAKFVSVIYNGKTLHKRKLLTVYSKDEDRKSLDYLYGLFEKVNKEISFVIMSDREIKVLETYNLHNFMSLSTFLKGNNKPYKRMMTALLVNDLINKYTNTFAYASSLTKVSKSLVKDLDELKKHKICKVNISIKETANLNLKEHAAKHNLYDLEMLNKISSVEKLLVNNPFIENICRTLKSYAYYIPYNENMINIMKEMCRYKKVRMNLSNYQLVEKQEMN